MPDVYLGPAWLLSAAVSGMALVRTGMWLRQSGRQNGRGKTGEAEAEFRGEVREMLKRQTEILLSIADDMGELQKTMALQTNILDRLTVPVRVEE